MAKSNLSKLDNAIDANPNVVTLTSYADALGKKLVTTLVDKCAGKSGWRRDV